MSPRDENTARSQPPPPLDEPPPTQVRGVPAAPTGLEPLAIAAVAAEDDAPPEFDLTPDEILFHRARAAFREPQRASSGGLIVVVLFVLFVVGELSDLKSPYVIADLISVIVFHEMGHAVGMRLFGFSDVRMFFIPFLGAVVSGRGRGVAAWKEAVVSLMGPIPGRYRTLSIARKRPNLSALAQRGHDELDTSGLREVYDAARAALPPEGQNLPHRIGEQMSLVLDAAKRPPRLLVSAALLAVYAVSLLAGIVGVVAIAHETAEPSWTSFDQPTWRVDFPQEPSVGELESESPSGPVRGLATRAAVLGTERFAVRVSPSRDADALARWVELAKKEIDADDDYELQRTHPFELGEANGTALDYRRPGRSLWVRVLVANGNRYLLTASAPAWGDRQERFFDSFRAEDRLRTRALSHPTGASVSR